MSIRVLPELQCATAFVSDDVDLRSEAVANWNPALASAAAEGDNVISILQPIGEGMFTEGFTAQRMAAALRSIGERDVIVHMNSPGGRIDQGVAIYNMLRQHKGRVTVKILGFAGSIASVITMAGDVIEIAKAGFMWVHNSEGAAEGNRHVMDEASAALREFDDMMAAVYADRSGQSTREVEKLMNGRNNGGTLMGSAMVIEKGLADSLLPGDAVRASAAVTLPRADILALRRIEALATSPDQVTRSEAIKLLNEIKAGMRDAADDATRDAGVNPDLLSVLVGIPSL